MKFLQSAVKLAFLFSLCNSINAFPEKSILSVESPDNFIIYEENTDQFSSKPLMPLKIQSDVPVTIQRYEKYESWAGSHPINEGDGIILVTSTCDTGGTDVVPSVGFEQDGTGATFVTIELSGVGTEEASQMPFLDSSSYDATWYESGCGLYTETTTPTQKPTSDKGAIKTQKPTSTTAGAVKSTACLTEVDCDEMRQQMGITKFLVGEYPSKGCFTKNGIAYWDSGGSIDDKSKTSLPGIQARVWCEKEVDLPGGSPPEESKEDGACITQSKCDEERLEMGIATFSAGNYPSKGCFKKNGNAYWGTGGSVGEMSISDLAGVQERIWCDKGKVDNPVSEKECEIGLSANPSKFCSSGNKFCQLDTGVCNNKSAIHGGICKDVPDMCIEIFLPVCGCDGETYENECKAHAKGISVSRNGKCGKAPDMACLTEEDCDEKKECEIGPNANPLKSCSSDKELCQLDTGVCNNKSGIHGGTCKDVPDACIEIFQPVCGCDGETYSNECKAHSKGMSVSLNGRCPDIACLTEEDCDEKRQEMGIETLYSDANYVTKGCFTKNGKSFFSTGSIDDMSEADLPGIQERIWCSKEGTSTSNINSVLQQGDTKTVSQEQHESATSSAFSLRSFMFTSLLYNVVSAKSDNIVPSPQSRALDTCSYNVQILLTGCDFGGPANIEVDAPRARVINSEMENQVQETYAMYESHQLEDGTKVYQKDFKHTATLAFPDEQAATINVSGDGFSEVPPFGEEKCMEIVCGRPFVDSKGNSLLASSISAGECDGDLSWLGETTQASSINNITSQNDLGEEWTRNALGEHASVASFSAFSIALMTNQAPSDLVEDALNAALDEVRHTKTSFDIASKLVGKVVGPGPLPPSRHEFNHDLTTLAMSVAKEGCVDETLSALAAAAECEIIDEVLENGAEEGTKYSGVADELLIWIRNELRTIALEEGGHSALAWRTLDWVCTVDANACGAAKRNILNEDKLLMAFQLRFSRYFEGNPELLERMMTAWTNIYTNLEVLHSDVEANDIRGSACVDGAVEGGSGDDLPNPSLLSLLVEKISRGPYSGKSSIGYAVA
eukprot:CAMPEP_0201902994 /NCGR_PEP_ID=MMETSP0902-20130614/55245_1 /ASSEMBLY_ACC=CAM_ASM_000551 /TAXON_ID=420261 /ORGANISM="Thalassiosira antarctica, Strain CCMP982" /LENGTH=1069 /DNA_ID=CAMNT_0048437021 /DNA_START=238 /DNA_END=3447 /DNA_ORIENTATION=-